MFEMKNMNFKIFIQIIMVCIAKGFELPPAKFFRDIAVTYDKDHLVFHYPNSANHIFVKWHKSNSNR